MTHNVISYIIQWINKICFIRIICCAQICPLSTRRVIKAVLKLRKCISCHVTFTFFVFNITVFEGEISIYHVLFEDLVWKFKGFLGFRWLDVMINEQVRTTIIALRSQPLPHAEPANLYFQWCGTKEDYITIAIIDNQKKSWYFLQSLNHFFYSPDNKDHSSHQTWTTSLRLGWPSRWPPSPPGQQRSGIAGPRGHQSRLLRRSQSGRRISPCSGLKGVFLLGMGNKQWGRRNGVRGTIIIQKI